MILARACTERPIPAGHLYTWRPRARNVNIVRYLLSRKDIKRTVRDSFGNTPLHCAASITHKNRNEIIRLFAPWNNSHNLSPDAKQAAQLFIATTIVDFSENLDSEHFGWTGNTVTKESLFDLLYNSDSTGTKGPSASADSDPDGFRWIHLPTNNVSWCLDLITKHFYRRMCAGRKLFPGTREIFQPPTPRLATTLTLHDSIVSESDTVSGRSR